MSDLEDQLLLQLRAAGLPEPLREAHLIPKRRFRTDFAYPDHMLAIEVEGGSYQIGRHQRPAGFEKDCEKYNLLTLHGYRLIRVTGQMVKDGRALSFVEQALLTKDTV